MGSKDRIQKLFISTNYCYLPHAVDNFKISRVHLKWKYWDVSKEDFLRSHKTKNRKYTDKLFAIYYLNVGRVSFWGQRILLFKRWYAFYLADFRQCWWDHPSLHLIHLHPSFLHHLITDSNNIHNNFRELLNIIIIYFICGLGSDWPGVFGLGLLYSFSMR